MNNLLLEILLEGMGQTFNEDIKEEILGQAQVMYLDIMQILIKQHKK